MKVLEHRVPPPLVAVLVAAGMWLTSLGLPTIQEGRGLRFGLTGALAIAAACLGVFGVQAFGRAGTTIDPLAIDRASSLVTTGVYRLTRNPMYVALALLLGAWAIWLAVPFTAAGPLLFVAFITRFQIVPEERALLGVFGPPYDAYRRRVRRWL